MKLERLISNVKDKEKRIKDFLYLENYINNGSPSGFTYKYTLNHPYKPGNINGFSVPIDLLKNNEVETFLANPSEKIKKFVEKSDSTYLFFIHPQEFKKGKYHATSYIKGYPTASGRTLLIIHQGSPFFVKLHYSGLLGRVGREMTKKRVKGAKIISEELDLLTRKGILASSFAFFPESYGLVTSKYGKEIGMTYREYTPRPYIKGERLMIPFFSLFGKDQLKRNDPTLLTQILSYKTHKKDFFLNKLIKSLLISFKTLVLDGGLVPESHGQNIVLEIDPDLKIGE